MSKAVGWIAYSFIVLFVFFGVCFVLLGTCYVYLQTDSGQMFLAKKAGTFLSQNRKGAYHLEKLKFDLGGNFSISGLIVSDDLGRPRLVLPSFDANVDLGHLFQKQIEVNFVQLHGLRFFAYESQNAGASQWLSTDIFESREPSSQSSPDFKWTYHFQIENLIVSEALVAGFGLQDQVFSSGVWNSHANLYIDRKGAGTYQLNWKADQSGMIQLGGHFKLAEQGAGLKEVQSQFEVLHLKPMNFLQDIQNVVAVNEAKKKWKIDPSEEIEINSRGNFLWNGNFLTSNLEIEDLFMRAFGGTIDGTLKMSQAALFDVQLKTTPFDLEKFPWEAVMPGKRLVGKLELSVSGKGKPQRPNVVANLQLCGMKILTNGPGVKRNVNAQSENQENHVDVWGMLSSNETCIKLNSTLDQKKATAQLDGRVFGLPTFAYATLLTEGGVPVLEEARLEIKPTLVKSILPRMSLTGVTDNTQLEASVVLTGVKSKTTAQFNLTVNEVTLPNFGAHKIFLSGEILENFSLAQIVIMRSEEQIAQSTLRVIPPQPSRFAFPTNYEELAHSEIHFGASTRSVERFLMQEILNETEQSGPGASLAAKVSLKDYQLTAEVLAEVTDSRASGGPSSGRGSLTLASTVPRALPKDSSDFLSQSFDSRLKLEFPRLQSIEKFFPQLALLKGELSGDIKWSGSVAKPSLEGELIGKEISVVPVSGPAWEEVGFQIKTSQDKITLENLRIVRGGEILGNASISGLLPGKGKVLEPYFQANVKTSKLNLLPLQSFSPSLTTQVNVEGNLTAQGALSAAVVVEEFELYVPVLGSALPKRGENLSPPKDLVVAGREKKQKANLGSQSRNLQTLLKTAQISFKTPQGMHVKGSDIALDAQADFEVNWNSSSKSDPLLIDGEAKLRRPGFVKVLGKRLDIQSASYQANNQPPAAGKIDAILTQSLQIARAKIQVSGAAARPEFQLSSDPELPQKDIAALIITGSTSSEFIEANSRGGSNESKGALDKATSMAANAVASKLSSEIFGNIMRDSDLVLTIDVKDAESHDANVGVGKYVTDKLFLTVEKNTAAETQENDKQVRFDYMLTPHWSLEGGIGDKQQGDVDLIWERKF